MSDTITANGQPWGISVTSGGNIYVLVEYNGYLEMWKNSGSGWSNVGTNQLYTDVHGKKGTAIGYATMEIDSTDLLHIVDSPIPAGVTIDLAYATFNTSTDTWSSWTEIAAVDTAYTSSWPTLLIDGSDNVWVAWGNQTSKNVQQVHITTDQSGSFSTTQIDDTTGNSNRPHLGIDSGGTVHYYWYNAALDDVCYRSWTSGGGWGSVHKETLGIWLDTGKVLCNGTNSYLAAQDLISSEYRLYRKDRTNNGATQSDGTGTILLDNSFLQGDQAYINSTEYLAVLRIFGSFNKLYVYEYSGSDTWTEKWALGSGSANCSNPYIAYSPFNANYGSTVHIVYNLSGTGVQYDALSGTPASGSTVAFLAGGGQATGSQSAWVNGDYSRGSVHGFVEGFEDGKSVRHAWMRGIPSSIPAYMRGTENWYFDVVQFDAPASSGTQDITGSLGGLNPMLVFLLGHGATANDTVTSDIREFFGFADGTNEVHMASYIQDTAGSSSYTTGAVNSTRCAGMFYSSGGYASWNSWLTNGVQLDWTVGSGIGAYQCAALMIATDSPQNVQSYVGTYSINDANTDDLFEITGVGFKPDLVIMLTPQGGSGMGMGVVQRNKDTDGILSEWCQNIAYNSGFYNWPGVCNSNTISIADGLNSYASGPGEKFEIDSWTDDGFYLKCVTNDGVQDTGTHYFIAIKNDSGILKIGTGTGNHPTSTGNESVNTGFRVGAVLMNSGEHTPTTCSFPTGSNSHGMSMFDAGAEVAGSDWTGFGGSPTDAKNVSHASRAVLLYDNTDTKKTEASVTSLDANGYTLNYTTAGGGLRNWLAFGTGEDARDKVSAYMFAHADFTYGFTRGQLHTNSSQAAFYYVVDAQDSKPCYTEGLEPARSSTTAFMMGSDDPLIIPVEFTCDTAGGNQNITDGRLNGLTPKAAIVYVFDGDSASSASVMKGITDGTDQYVMSHRALSDTTYPHNCTTAHRKGKLIVVRNGDYEDPQTLAEGTFNTWLTNGMQIAWSTTPTAAFPGVVIFFAGSQLSAKAGDTEHPGSAPSTVNVTSPAFRPNFVAFLNDANIDVDISNSNSLWFQGWAVDDSNSPEPTQQALQLKHSIGSSEAGSSAESFSMQTTYPDKVFRDYVYVDQFTASGFDLRFTNFVSGWDVCWLAIKLDTSGRRKAHIIKDEQLRAALYDQLLPSNPQGNYNLVPELVIGHPMLMFDYLGLVAMVPGNWNVSVWGGGTSVSFSNICWAEYLNPSEAYDQLCKSIKTTGQKFDIWGWLYESGTWVNLFAADFTPTVHGIEVSPTVANLQYFDDIAQDDFKPMFFVIGVVEYTSSIPAYMKGEKVDWRGRTPRGAYLEGSAIPVNSSTPAFIQVINVSSTSAYTEGYVVNESSRAAFVGGSLDVTSSVPCYMFGNIFVVTSVPCYTHGKIDATPSSYEAHLWGKDNTTSNSPAYANGIAGSTGSIPAYILGDIDRSSLPAYMEGLESTSSTPAYTNGFSTSVDSNQEAYVEGKTFFPFTDDFTGNDQDPWIISKWATEEYGPG